MIAGVFLAIALAQNARAEETLIGVLEQVPQTGNEPKATRIRVAFRNDGHQWNALQADCDDEDSCTRVAALFPKAGHWTVAFDGKNVGVLDARVPAQSPRTELGCQIPVAGSRVPVWGKATTEFAGFLGRKVYRPLITVSGSHFGDPEHWKPASLGDASIIKLRAFFHRRFPAVENCVKQDTENARPWKYSDSDIKVVRAYSSSSGRSVAKLQLGDYLCDGIPDDPFDDQWFVLDSDGTVRYLDTGLVLVDAGDYDGDGKSELVFLIDRYNRGGYELFSDGLTKHVSYEFTYH